MRRQHIRYIATPTIPFRDQGTAALVNRPSPETDAAAGLQRVLKGLSQQYEDRHVGEQRRACQACGRGDPGQFYTGVDNISVRQGATAVLGDRIWPVTGVNPEGWHRRIGSVPAIMEVKMGSRLGVQKV